MLFYINIKSHWFDCVFSLKPNKNVEVTLNKFEKLINIKSKNINECKTTMANHEIDYSRYNHQNTDQ